MFYQNVQVIVQRGTDSKQKLLLTDFYLIKMKLFGSKVIFRKVSVNQRVMKGWKSWCCFSKRKAALWLKTPEEILCVMTFFFITVLPLVHLIKRYLITIVLDKVHAKYISQSTLFKKWLDKVSCLRAIWGCDRITESSAVITHSKDTGNKARAHEIHIPALQTTDTCTKKLLLL